MIMSFCSLNKLIVSEIPVSKDGAISPLISDQEEVPMSRNAIAHPFKKLRGPARCRECDTYVYFHGYECETVSGTYMYRVYPACE